MNAKSIAGDEIDVCLIPLNCRQDIVAQMRKCDVEDGGILIMKDKFECFCVKVTGIDNIVAHVLKQSMLSCGAEAAVNKHVISGKASKSDALLFGSIAHFKRLSVSLKGQSWKRVRDIGLKIDAILRQKRAKTLAFKCGEYELDLKRRTHIMGILNVTTDSFFDGGAYIDCQKAIDRAFEMKEQGADIIDIGAVNGRFRNADVTELEEWKRLEPIIESLKGKINIPISIDTFRLGVMKKCIDAGCDIINNVFGTNCVDANGIDASSADLANVDNASANDVNSNVNNDVAKLIGQSSVGYILTHCGVAKSKNMVENIVRELGDEVQNLVNYGCEKERICLDAGYGLPYGKNAAQQFEMLKNTQSFVTSGLPLLAGLSRKSFLKPLTGNKNQQSSVVGSVVSAVFAASHGANIVRVHDVKETKEAITMCDLLNGKAAYEDADLANNADIDRPDYFTKSDIN